MENNLKMMEIIERIKKTADKESKVNCSKDAIKQADIFQKKKGNGQSENFSKRCPLCDDTTWVEYRKDKRICAYRCECFTKKKNDKSESFKKAGLTLESSKLNFTEFKTWNGKVADMKVIAINYYKDFEKIKNTRQNSIIFCGNPGSGKSHLCIAIANNLMVKKNQNVVYMPYRDVIIAIKQNMLDAEGYSQTLNKYKKVDVLLIDDLFKGQGTQSDINIMFEIINYRYMNNLPMIISTELTIDELVKVDEAIASRIYEMIKDYTVEIIGIENNYRFKA